jgi:hypothetical protein
MKFCEWLKEQARVFKPAAPLAEAHFIHGGFFRSTETKMEYGLYADNKRTGQWEIKQIALSGNDRENARHADMDTATSLPDAVHKLRQEVNRTQARFPHLKYRTAFSGRAGEGAGIISLQDAERELQAGAALPPSRPAPKAAPRTVR